MLAYAFPGQGSQYEGMGKALLERYPDVEEIFKLADSLTSLNLSRLLTDASEEELKDTVNTQPAIFLHSAALYNVLKRVKPPDVVFGHSLGEISALYAAGVFDFETSLKLIIERARLMGRGARGSMLAVVGEGAHEAASEVLERGNFSNLVIANYNSPKQVVLSGSEEEISRASQMLKDMFGRKLRLIPLKVGGAFHSPFMDAASKMFARLLEGVKFRDPKIPVIMNSTGRVARTAQEVKEAYSVQLRSSVHFIDMVKEAVKLGVSEVWEVGPGRVLCSLIYQITDRITCRPQDPKIV